MNEELGLTPPYVLRSRKTGVHDHAIHRSMRSRAGTVATLGIGLFIGVSPLLPGVGERLGLPLWLTVSTTTAFILVVLAASAMFRLQGRDSIAYDVANKAETFVSITNAMVYVYFSPAVASFFWLLYFGVLFHASTSGSHRLYNSVVILGAPLMLALAYGVFRQDMVDATLAVVGGAIGGTIYVFISGAMRQLAIAQEERAMLQAQVSELLVRQERARIARDLHDGLGAELAALMWRARALQEDVQDQALRDELGGFMERVRQGTDELRNIVFALRSDGQPWPDVVAHLRGRGMELCAGHAEFVLDDEGDGADLVLPGELALNLVRVVQEAVRNAVRHSEAKRIAVSLSLADRLRVVVEDDGRGLPEGAVEKSAGGLKNIRQRARAMGGSVEMAARNPGTRIELVVPVGRA